MYFGGNIIGMLLGPVVSNVRPCVCLLMFFVILYIQAIVETVTIQQR